MKQLSFVLLFLILVSCEDKTPIICAENDISAPQIILVVGQSNTHAGYGLDPILDAPMAGIHQLGRFDNDNCIIPACEPLDHHTRSPERIGFAMTFSKLLYQHLQGSNELIIVPCGFGGTGFADNNWNKTNDLYEDAVCRVNMLKEEFPQATVAAILWHQGETDVYLGNQNYQEDLDNFIDNLRSDIGDLSIPFVLGGMVPYWVNQAPDRQQLQQILKDTPLRHDNVAYADPELPFVIEKPDNTFDEIHYDANGQRELGQRYFEQFLDIIE